MIKKFSIAVVVIIGILIIISGLRITSHSTNSPKILPVVTAPSIIRFPPLDTIYVTAQGWPPSVNTTTDPFSCSGDSSIERTINGKRYCVTTVTEGAAGSTYSTYTYRTENVQTVFTLRFVQCDNYSGSQRTDCKNEQKSFNPDMIVEPAANMACYTRHQYATGDAPYKVDEKIAIITNGSNVTGTKTGTQSGPDMTNGYGGTLNGTVSGNILTALFDYTIEGSENKEQEEYTISDFELTKHRYPLIEQNNILVPDKSKSKTDIVYSQISCN